MGGDGQLAASTHTHTLLFHPTGGNREEEGRGGVCVERGEKRGGWWQEGVGCPHGREAPGAPKPTLAPTPRGRGQGFNVVPTEIGRPVAATSNRRRPLLSLATSHLLFSLSFSPSLLLSFLLSFALPTPTTSSLLPFGWNRNK